MLIQKVFKIYDLVVCLRINEAVDVKFKCKIAKMYRRQSQQFQNTFNNDKNKLSSSVMFKVGATWDQSYKDFTA